MYWAFTTLTTVGYGDVLPVSRAEMVVTMIVQFAGTCILGYVMGDVASMLTKERSLFGSRTRPRHRTDKAILKGKADIPPSYLITQKAWAVIFGLKERAQRALSRRRRGSTTSCPRSCARGSG